jgi:hypothetical protein
MPTPPGITVRTPSATEYTAVVEVAPATIKTPIQMNTVVRRNVQAGNLPFLKFESHFSSNGKSDLKPLPGIEQLY